MTMFLFALLAATFTAPAAMAKPLQVVTVAMEVDATDCGAVVLTAHVDWRGRRPSILANGQASHTVRQRLPRHEMAISTPRSTLAQATRRS